MKLTTKVVLVFLLGILFVQSINAYWLTRRENEQFEREMMLQARYLSDSMKEQLDRSAESETMLELVRNLTRQMDHGHHAIRVRFVYLRNWPSKQFEPTVAAERVNIAYGKISSFPSSDAKGERWLHVYSPIGDMNGRPACLEFTSSLSAAERYNRSTLYQHLGVAAATLLCGFGVALLGIKLVGNRLQLLIAKTKRISAGDFSHPVHVKGNDELSQLGEALNEMCDSLAASQARIRAESTARIAAVEQLRHADRLNTVGRLASGVAHEMGTPLNVVSGRAGLIASGQLSQEEVRDSARIIKDETDRITRIIRQLLDFARRGTPQRADVDLRDVARQTIDLVEPIADKQHVSIAIDAGEHPLRARVDVGQIQQVLTNLTVNAMQAMPAGGAIDVELGTVQAANRDDPTGKQESCFRISVRDQGQGIRDEDLPYLFEPFFTTKEIGEGTGLGLSVSYGIVQDHGGWIDVATEPGKGSCFTIYLPREANQCPDES